MSPRGPLLTVYHLVLYNTQFGKNTQEKNFFAVDEFCCYQLTSLFEFCLFLGFVFVFFFSLLSQVAACFIVS